MKSKKYIINLFIYTIILISIVIVGVRTYLPNQYDRISKNRLYVVMSDSMSPTIDPYALIVVDKSNSNYKIDDIISFKYDINDDGRKEIITHKITSINNGIYKTMSEKYDRVDPWEVKQSDIVGKVKYIIPNLGLLVLALQHVALPLLTTLLLLIISLLTLTLIRWSKL